MEYFILGFLAVVTVVLAWNADTKAKHYKRKYEGQLIAAKYYKGKYDLLSYAVYGEF